MKKKLSNELIKLKYRQQKQQTWEEKIVYKINSYQLVYYFFIKLIDNKLQELVYSECKNNKTRSLQLIRILLFYSLKDMWKLLYQTEISKF